MSALIAWLVYLKAYRLKHPELTLQQAQKNASVGYKRAFDPIIGAKLSRSITGKGPHHSEPIRPRPELSVGDMKPDELLDFRDVIDAPLNNAHIPIDIRKIISEYDVRDPNNSISDLIEEKQAVSNRIAHLGTPEGRNEFLHKWADNQYNLFRLIGKSHEQQDAMVFQDYDKAVQKLHTDRDERQRQIEEIGQHSEPDVRGRGIQPDLSPGVYFHPHVHSTSSSNWYIDAHVRRLD
jgi:hypothetical protein